MNERYVAYYRVSTQKQGMTGLGMDAQETAVNAYLGGSGVGGAARELIASFKEVETGKRAGKTRPELQKAIEMVKETGARLLIAKLDRLSRNTLFLLTLKESGVEFVACDFPEANKLTLTLLAAFAEHEAEMISQRTKAALQAAKARGVKLGNPRWKKTIQATRNVIQAERKVFTDRAKAIIEEIRAAGVVEKDKIAQCMNARGEKTMRNMSWTAWSVYRVDLHYFER